MPRRLAAVLHAPDGGPRGAAVVCHPHPQYGGDMENAVVVAVVRALVAAGHTALRFDFGGVGASEGSYGHGRDEQCDVGAAVAALAARVGDDVPLAVVGYSFGAWAGAMAARGLAQVRRVVAIAPPLAFFDWSFAQDLGKPLAIVAGDRDQYCPPDALRRLVDSLGATATILPGADHFLAGREADAAGAVVALL